MTIHLHGTTGVVLWTTLFYLQLYVSDSQQNLCKSAELPESIELINSTNYACYGCNNYFQASCRIKNNTVIAVQAVKVGSKRRNLDCPDSVPSLVEECSNTTCCKPDVNDDCINVYNYTDAGIDYRFHRECSGYPICTETIEAVRALTNCPTSSKEYMNVTNYMFMEYACINRSRMFDMCKNGTMHSDNETLYLHTPGYPKFMTTQMTSNCTCTLSSDGNMTLKAYLIDVQLVNKTLTVGDSMFHNASGIWYNVTHVTIEHGETVTLETVSDSQVVDTKVWMGVKVPTGKPFDITCWGPSVDPIISTPLDGSSGLSVLDIVLIVVGIFLVLLVFLCCCLYKCFKKKKEIKPQKKMHDKAEDVPNDMPIDNRSNSAPMNTSFSTQRIPTARVEPTRFIEEHGGLRHKSTLPIIPSTMPTGILSTNAGPTRLEPLQTSQEQVEISDQIVRKHKKKKKKRRKHKHSETENIIVDTPNENNDEVQKHETDA